MDRTDVVVVGGGIAGLVAAARIARNGLAVRLMEATRAFGGRARTQIRDGYRFNQGPHALYNEGRLNRSLTDLGVTVSGASPDLQTALAILQGGAERHVLPLHAGAIAQSTLLDDADRAQLVETITIIAGNSDDRRGFTLGDFTRCLRPRVAAAVEAIVRLVTYVDGVDEIDADAAFRQVRLSFGGVRYLDGGWATIVDGLTHAAIAADAILSPALPVRAIEAGDGGWIIRDGQAGAMAASAVVIATPPEQVAKLLPTARSVSQAVAAVRPVECVGLDLALSTLPCPASQYALGIDAPVYLACHSTYAELAPAGGALVHLLRYLPPGERPARRHLDQLEETMDRLQPGWRSFEVHRQRLFGARVANDLPAAKRRGTRTPMKVDECPGIFLAGDWIGDEGMLSDAAAASAEAAAAAATAWLSVSP